MNIEAEIKRLRRLVWVQGLFLFAIIAWVGWTWFEEYNLKARSSVVIYHEGDSVRLSSGSDRAFVVTHLAVADIELSDSDKKIAALPAPVASISSGSISVDGISKLDWRDAHGGPVKPPSSTERIAALILRPEEVTERPR